MNWGSRWLDTVERSGAFSTHALRRGADFARYDWQLEVIIEPGSASTTARAGRRMTYDATVRVPVAHEDVWADLAARIAASNEETAALLDGELADDVGAPLFPDPSDLDLSCTCRTNDRPCKHAVATLYLMAEAIDEDPFELLHVRGLTKPELVSRVNTVRRSDYHDAGGNGDGSPDESDNPDSGVTDRSGDDDHPQLVWHDVLAELPPEHPPPDQAGELPPFPSEPPANAGFTSHGLRTLASDAAARAFDLLDGSGDTHRRLDPTVDLARRASVARDTDRFKHLVDQSGLTNRELNARAVAWERGGAEAVAAHVAPIEVRKGTDETGDAVQWRRTSSDVWVRFDKISGRWEAASAPTPAPPDDLEASPEPGSG